MNDFEFTAAYLFAYNLGAKRKSSKESFHTNTIVASTTSTVLLTLSFR